MKCNSGRENNVLDFIPRIRIPEVQFKVNCFLYLWLPKWDNRESELNDHGFDLNSCSWCSVGHSLLLATLSLGNKMCTYSLLTLHLPLTWESNILTLLCSGGASQVKSFPGFLFLIDQFRELIKVQYTQQPSMLVWYQERTKIYCRSFPICSHFINLKIWTWERKWKWKSKESNNQGSQLSSDA